MNPSLPLPALPLLLSAAILLLAAPWPLFAQTGYPSKVVRIIVPTSPAGTNDMLARLIAQALSERLGRQFIVENRTGAGTMVGGEVVAKSQPDGHTLLMGLSTLAINPATYRRVPYDALRDFTPITQVAYTPNLMIVHPSVPAKSVKELIALARSRPGEILYASSGHGTNPHLTMELFATQAGIRMVHVPYKSSIPSLIDLIAGQVAIMTSPMPQSIVHVRSGRVRALGVTTPVRVGVAPEIPTIQESGLPGFESVQWYGLLAPARTPPAIVDRLHQEVATILRSADVRARLAGDGAEPVASPPEAFAAFIKAETLKWAAVAKAAGIIPE